MKKKIALQFFGTVKRVNGQLRIVLDNPTYYAKYLNKSFQEGDKVIMGVRERKKIRTLKQNALWWVAVVTVISDHTGDTPDNVHEDLKRILLPKTVRTGIDGEIITEPGSTKEQSTQEFNELVEKARAWAQEFLGITLPLPEEIEDNEAYQGINY